jgi:HD-like signal output (HDOD) protein
MKARRLLSAAEVKELQGRLQVKLENVGLSSQPEVAIKMLELSNRPDAQLADYAKLIAHDQATAGRVLRLANSAFFAQRKPVTAIDRACVVLGVDRLRAVVLGFHLSRAAQCPDDRDLSRKIWGQSLLRACMGSQIARLSAPNLVSEAFIIGLMMDAGLPLMGTLAGAAFRNLLRDNPSPGRLHRLEFDTLEFTHVDVIIAMMTSWKLPELLIKPIERHHVKPSENKLDDPISRLHRIAYVVGLIELECKGGVAAEVTERTPGVTTAQRLLNLTDPEVSHVVKKSFSEYEATSEMFKEVAAHLNTAEDLMEQVQLGLSKAVDAVIEQGMNCESVGRPMRLVISGNIVEVVRESNGDTMAYLYDTNGRRMLSHTFQVGTTPEDLCEALGIEAGPKPDMMRLGEAIMRLAA